MLPEPIRNWPRKQPGSPAEKDAPVTLELGAEFKCQRGGKDGEANKENLMTPTKSDDSPDSAEQPATEHHAAEKNSLQDAMTALLDEASAALEQEAENRRPIVHQMLMTESDRGCVIFGAAILDDCLEALLRAVFRQDEATVKNVINPLFEGYAPLASFSARTAVAFALCLIPKDIKEKLDILRKMRNDFAHESGPMSFDDPSVDGRIQSLVGDLGVPDLDKYPVKRMRNRLAFASVLGYLTARLRYLTLVMRQQWAASVLMAGGLNRDE
jgi:DNA-binding MltR family transcriptional regulator